MKTLILYGSPTKLTGAHKPVHFSTRAMAPDYFVRAEKFEGGVVLALDKARPQEGETVLNTIEIP